MEKNSRTKVSISLDAIAQNFEEMHRKLPKETKMMAVIKADGYGHGALAIAKTVESYEYVWGFATATAQEAWQLREAGIHKPILVLGYTFQEDDALLVREEIRPTVFQYETAKRLSQEAARQGKTVHIHLALDTGMARIGFPVQKESVREILKIQELDFLEIEGLFTHFAKADEADLTYTAEQLRQYEQFCQWLLQEGVAVPIRHCANSAGIMCMPRAYLDMVRAGIIMYGIYPSDEVEREKLFLRPAMEWKAQIAYVKTVPAGCAVSYGGTYVTEKETRIATIPVGYADGYPRSLSNKGWILVHGQKAPILGRVCMDQFMVDVTNIPQVCQHDEVTLIGWDHQAFLSVEELARLSGRFPYEFVCDIGPRVPRVYIQNYKEIEEL